uniref:Lymphotoxin-alpha n=1 Tax=Canis lupus familiaris TaxID=9615 RepID=A0A8C0YSY0_CANLF
TFLRLRTLRSRSSPEMALASLWVWLPPPPFSLPGCLLSPSLSKGVLRKLRFTYIKISRLPAAHLIGAWTKGQGLGWEAKKEEAFLRSGTLFSGAEGLALPRDGLYYLYCHVGYRGRAPFPRATDFSLSLSHIVHIFLSHHLYHTPHLSTHLSLRAGPHGPVMRDTERGAETLVWEGDWLSQHEDGISALLLSAISLIYGAFPF